MNDAAKAPRTPKQRELRARDCADMAEVREVVDRIDRELVALLVERQACMEAAARIKTERASVRDPARIEEVVAKVLASARAAGLSPAIAEPVWRLLIERCIAHEFEVWDQMRAEPRAEPSARNAAAERP